MPRPAAGFPRKNSSQDVRISRRGDERPSALAQKEALVHQLVGVACHLLHIASVSAVELLEPLPAEIELITGVRTRVRDDAAGGEARRRDTGTRTIDCDAAPPAECVSIRVALHRPAVGLELDAGRMRRRDASRDPTDQVAERHLPSVGLTERRRRYARWPVAGQAGGESRDGI